MSTRDEAEDMVAAEQRAREAEARIIKGQPFSCDECARLEGELSDMKELRDAAEQNVREAEARLAILTEDGTWREKFFMALNDLEVLRFSHEQELREAEVRELEWALELLPTRLGVRVWAEDVRAAINAKIARLTQVDEQERYDCPIHGVGESKDCPRC